MSQGICIFAQNNDKTNYVQQAIDLAYSIKKFNPSEKISVITNDDCKDSIFDNIISIPNDTTNSSMWRIDNRAKVFDLTPYEQTIVFDSDVLLTHSTEKLWHILENKDLYFTTKVINHRGNEIKQDTVHRKMFIDNDLPNIYSAFFYFRKTENNQQFFDLLQSIVVNWDSVYKAVAPINRQSFCSIDVSIAICCKLLGIEIDKNLWPVIHMKTPLQDLQRVKNWSESVMYYANDDGLFINNYKQTGIFHYVEKQFVNNDIREWLCTT